VEPRSVRRNYLLEEDNTTKEKTANGKPVGASDDKRFLRISNTLLIASVAIALICLVVLTRRNLKLQQERLRLLSNIQTMSGTHVEPPSAQVGEILPSFEARNFGGARSGVLYDGKSKYLFYIFSPQCGVCINEFSTWSRITPHARSKDYRVVGLSTYSEEGSESEFGTMDRNFEVTAVPSMAIQRAYGVTAVPMVMLVSGKGKIEWVHYGKLPQEKIKELLSKIDNEDQ
jgi:peroxiredoxin